MLAMADKNGRVWASVPGLANRARIDVEAARAALASFMAPDPDSRTKEHEGRRIEEIEGGWRLFNHAKYRAIRDEESIKESKRNYINQRRAREKAETVENVERSRHIAEAEAEADTSKDKAGASLSLAPPDSLETVLPSNIPYKEIVALYHEHMVRLPRVTKLSNDRRALLRKAWHFSKDWQRIEFWKQYFEECSEDAFLNGSGPYFGQFIDWTPTFDHLMRTKTVLKTYEKARYLRSQGK